MAGIVWLVGAGPGDPKLLTLRGRECIEGAEVVVYDRLVSTALLQHAPQDAELIYVGKAVGREAMTQVEINALLLKFSLRGKKVCRLKGGDPFVFGRGGGGSGSVGRWRCSFRDRARRYVSNCGSCRRGYPSD